MAAEKLDEEDLVNFREAFRKFDPEETDIVSVENIGNVLRAAGQAPSISDIEDYTKELDPQGTGDIQFNQLADLFARIMKSSFEMDDELHNAFRVLDKDKLGIISASDLRRYLTTLGETLSQEEIDELIKDADTGGDGKINYEEFCYTILNDNV